MNRFMFSVVGAMAAAAILLLAAEVALAQGSGGNPRQSKPWSYGNPPYYSKPWSYGNPPYYQRPPVQYYPVVPSYPYGYGTFYPPPYNGYVYPPQIYQWTPFGFRRWGY